VAVPVPRCSPRRWRCLPLLRCSWTSTGGAGIDLLIGGETATGLRWTDIAFRDGRLSWDAVREALPTSVLSGSRRAYDIIPGAVDAVVDAGRNGGVTVVCDLPRQLSAVTRPVFDTADLVVMVAPCDVRSCAATTAAAAALTGVNPNVGLVVRGPSPGGLRAGEFAEMAGVPLLASMRPEPMLGEKLERGGLTLRGRSPLGAAARRVLAVLSDSPALTQERVA
jgi:secretion/DNA translocation related CpaE-like protein